jgi:hypothetical protein
MKNVVLFLALAWANAFHMATAMEPSIVLVTSEEPLVYRTNNGLVELKGRRANRAVLSVSQQGQALQESPDRERLVAAYATNFLDCGRDVIAPEPLKEWIRQELESTAKDARIRRLVTTPVNDSYVMVSAQGGERGLVLNRETGERLPGSPCGAAVKFVRVSSDKQRVAFVFEELKAVDFFGRKGHMLWDARRSGAHLVQLHQLRATRNPSTTSTIAEDPLDLMLTDEGNWWLLVAKHSIELWNPANWLYALAGHPTRHSDISFQTYTSAGVLLSSVRVASRVKLSAGRLVNEHLE